MDNNINSIEIYAILAQRYRQDIKITELHGGRDKDVYVAELSGMRKFAVLVNKKNTIMRKYRTVRSNYFQKYLYKKGIKVPDVLDLFEIERGPILACHTYIEGKQITKLNKKTAYLCGKIVAQMHQAVILEDNYYLRYSFKYKICQLIKFFTDYLRLLKGFITDWQRIGLPNGMCHRDLNLSNFIFTNNDVYLIDFDRHRLWPFVYEIRRFLKSEDNCEYAVDFLKGYQSIRQLTQKERQYMSEQGLQA